MLRNNAHTDCETYGITADNIDGCGTENDEFASQVNSGFAKKINIVIWVRSVTKGMVLKDNGITDQQEVEQICIESPSPIDVPAAGNPTTTASQTAVIR